MGRHRRRFGLTLVAIGAAFAGGIATDASAAGFEAASATMSVRGLDDPLDALVSPDGRALYLVSDGGEEYAALAALSRDPASGLITQPAGPRTCLLSRPRSGCTRVRGWSSGSSPGALAMSTDSRTLYAEAVEYLTPKKTADVFAVFRRTADGGLVQLAGRDGCLSLTPTRGCTPARGSVTSAYSYAAGLEVAGDGRSAYVPTPNSILAFRRNETGALHQLRGPDGCLSAVGVRGCRPAPAMKRLKRAESAVRVSGDGRFAYVLQHDRAKMGLAVQALARDAQTGALRPLTGRGSCITSVPRSGCRVARGLGSAALGRYTPELLLAPDGQNLYVAGSAGFAVLTLSVATGRMEQPAGDAACRASKSRDGCSVGPASSLFLSADGGSAYVTKWTGTRTDLYVLDREPSSGALSPVVGPGGCLSAGQTAGCTHVEGLSDNARWFAGRDAKRVFSLEFLDGPAATFGATFYTAVHVFDRESGGDALAPVAGTSGCAAPTTVTACTPVTVFDERLGFIGDGPVAFGHVLALSPDGRDLYVSQLDSIVRLRLAP